MTSYLDSMNRIWDRSALIAVWFASAYFLMEPPILGEIKSLGLEKYFLSGLFLMAFGYIPLNLQRIIFFIKKHQGISLILLICYLLPIGRYQSFFALKKPFIDLALAIIFFVVFPRNLKNRSAIGVTMVFLLFFGLLALPFGVFQGDLWHPDFSYKGNFIHRNALGYFCIPVIIWALGSDIATRYRAVVLVAGELILGLSMSRSFWLASLLVFSYFFFQKRKWLLLIFCLFFHVFLLFIWSAEGKFIARGALSKLHFAAADAISNSNLLVHERSFETSTAERLDLLQQGLITFSKQSWLVGSGAPTQADSRFNKKMDLNNFFLTHLISYGVLISFFTFSLFVALWRKSGMHLRLMLIHLGVFASVQSFFDYFQSTYFFITLVILYIMAVLDARNSGQLATGK